MEEERKKREFEVKKEAALRRILTPEARSRLANLKIIKPQLAEALELEIIRLAQEGRIPIPVTDETLKKLLIQIDKQYRREIRIRRL